MDFVCFENELRSCISDCFDDRLEDLYTLIGINEGDVSPLQSVRLNSILVHFSGELTALAVELAAQNKKRLPQSNDGGDGMNIYEELKTIQTMLWAEDDHVPQDVLFELQDKVADLTLKVARLYGKTDDLVNKFPWLYRVKK